jgi:hypothetical protein
MAAFRKKVHQIIQDPSQKFIWGRCNLDLIYHIMPNITKENHTQPANNNGLIKRGKKM